MFLDESANIYNQILKYLEGKAFILSIPTSNKGVSIKVHGWVNASLKYLSRGNLKIIIFEIVIFEVNWSMTLEVSPNKNMRRIYV